MTSIERAILSTSLALGCASTPPLAVVGIRDYKVRLDTTDAGGWFEVRKGELNASWEAYGGGRAVLTADPAGGCSRGDFNGLGGQVRYTSRATICPGPTSGVWHFSSEKWESGRWRAAPPVEVLPPLDEEFDFTVEPVGERGFFVQSRQQRAEVVLPDGPSAALLREHPELLASAVLLGLLRHGPEGRVELVELAAR